jgi:hypothetical protein
MSCRLILPRYTSLYDSSTTLSVSQVWHVRWWAVSLYLRIFKPRISALEIWGGKLWRTRRGMYQLLSYTTWFQGLLWSRGISWSHESWYGQNAWVEAPRNGVLLAKYVRPEPSPWAFGRENLLPFSDDPLEPCSPRYISTLKSIGVHLYYSVVIDRTIVTNATQDN